jgi:heparanase
MQAFALPFAERTRRVGGVVDVRVGETAAVNHGGWSNVTDGFVSGFWTLYQLGWLAQAGFTVMQRQALACGPRYRDGRGAYGLLSVSPAFEPTPDYWLSLLFTRLMGTAVLNASAAVTVDGAAAAGAAPFATPAGLERTVRLFAHCSADGAGAPAGAVTLAFANPQTFGVVIDLGAGGRLAASARDEYRLSPPAGDAMRLRSHSVVLNGAATPLAAAADGTAPVLPAARASGTLRLAPLTYGFIVLRDANAPACA